MTDTDYLAIAITQTDAIKTDDGDYSVECERFPPNHAVLVTEEQLYNLGVALDAARIVDDYSGLHASTRSVNIGWCLLTEDLWRKQNERT